MTDSKRGLSIGLALVLVAALLVAVPVVALAEDAAVATAKANLHPANQSGVIAKITFVDGGGFGIATGGTATGLVPSFGRYVSLVYDNGSVPGGPDNCEPTVEMPDMFVGIWAVDAAGDGVLIPLFPILPLGSFDTVSIRDTAINDGFGPDAVAACGQVSVHPAG